MMKFKLLLLLLAMLSMLLPACNSLVTPTSETIRLPAASPILILPSNTPSPTLVFESTLTPTVISTPVTTSTPLQRVGNIYPIQFPPDRTFVDIFDSLASGVSKTYSINAMKGQVMSISVLVGPDNSYTIAPLKIVGADGTYICPDKKNQNYSCAFWRGVLPATQDYYVTLTPEIFLSNFTLRVAINPLNVPSQSFSYESRDGAISFIYNDDFAPIRFRNEVIYKIWPEVSLELIALDSLKNTDFREAFFMFGSSKDRKIVESCTQPVSFDGLEVITGEVKIDGVVFTRSEVADSWTDTKYENTHYRAVYNGACYEITFYIQSKRNDSGRKFDRDALMQKFEAILSTLVIR